MGEYLQPIEILQFFRPAGSYSHTNKKYKIIWGINNTKKLNQTLKHLRGTEIKCTLKVN